ncbi:MAG: permease [Bacillota bacterium]
MDNVVFGLKVVLNKTGATLWGLWPYLAGGVLAGEILKLTSWTKIIYRAVSRAPFRAVFTAAILGMVSPLCTYGTIPVVLQLCSAGVHIGPVVAFLCTSSLMNPQLFIITWGGISPEMAIVRALTVFVFGLCLGLVVYRIPVSWIVNPGILEAAAGGGSIMDKPAKVFRWRRFLQDIWENLQFVAFYFLIGTIIGAVVEAFTPNQWLAYLFRRDKWLSVLLAALMGVPLYACGGGTIPIIRSMIHQGMSKGAALAFFLVGPATRVTPLMAMAAVVKPRCIAGYLFLLIVFAVTMGFLYR